MQYTYSIEKNRGKKIENWLKLCCFVHLRRSDPFIKIEMEIKPNKIKHKQKFILIIIDFSPISFRISNISLKSAEIDVDFM